MKPTKKVVEHFDYHECVKHIETKLGYCIRDTLGRWRGPDAPKEVEYRDFWHFICDTQDPHNPCYIYIGSDWLDRANEWQAEIINAFIEEFGDNQEYWVEW